MNQDADDLEAIFEAFWCISSPIPSSRNSLNIDQLNSLYSILSQAFSLTDSQFNALRDQAQQLTVDGEMKIQLLYDRLCVVSNDQHPFYNQHEFGDLNYIFWKDKEIIYLKKLLEIQLNKSESSQGYLKISIQQAKGFHSNNNSTNLNSTDPFDTLSIFDQKSTQIAIGFDFGDQKLQWTEDNLLNSSSTDLSWSKSIEQYFTYFPSSPMKIDVKVRYNNQEPSSIGLIELSTDLLKNVGASLESWYTLSESIQLHLKVEYVYRFQRYFGPYVGLTLQKSNAFSFHFHSNYRRLQQRITNHLDKLPESNEQPLMPEAIHWLLDEFGDQFGVESAYRALVLLDCVADHVKATRGHLQAVDVALNAVDEGSLPPGLTNYERLLLKRTTGKLLDRIESFLIRFYFNFPRSKGSGIVALSLRLFRRLSTKENYSRLLETIVEEAYGVLKQVAREEISKKFTASLEAVNMSASHLIVVCDSIISFVNDSISFYDNEFGLDANISMKLIKQLLIELEADIKIYTSTESSLFDEHAFSLYFQLRDLQKWRSTLKIRNGAIIKDMPLQTYFYGFAVRWLNVTLERTLEWISESCHKEELEPINDEMLHSESVINLFTSLTQSYQFLQSLDMSEATFYSQFAEIVGQALISYVNGLMRELEMRKNMRSVEYLGNDQESPHFIISKELCILMNNIDHSRVLYEKLIEWIRNDLEKLSEFDRNSIKLECINETIESTVQTTNEFLDKRRKEVNDFVCVGFQSTVEPWIIELVNNWRDNPDDMEPLFCYLDSQIETISYNLYPDRMKRIMRKFWSIVVSTLEKCLQPEELTNERPPPDDMQIKGIRSILEQLRSYFHADGQALPLVTINKEAIKLTSMLQLCDQTTHQLISLYQKEKESGIKSDLDPDQILKVLRMRAFRHDETADNFLNGAMQIVPASPAKPGCTIF